MKQTSQSRTESFNAAIEGIILATKTEKNMKIHFAVALCAILLALFLRVSKIDVLLIFISAFFVLFAETLNTSIEYLADFVSKEYSPKIAAIKNLAAGAVFLSAFGSFIVGYIIFSKYLYYMIYYILFMMKTTGSDIAIVVIAIVFVGIIIIKALFNKGTPLRGGFPSGHAAIAFSIWLMVSFLTMNPVASLLTFIMAVLIALSRINSGVHTKLEVFVGGLIGVLITALIFKLFYF
ncbi:MAG: diacylglycerol kinase [bacterium]